jgi:hypothetical protein
LSDIIKYYSKIYFEKGALELLSLCIYLVIVLRKGSLIIK